LRRVHERARPRRGRVRPRSVQAHHLRGSGKALKYAGNPKTGTPRKEIKKFTHQLADGEHGDAHRETLSQRPGLRSMAHHARVAAYSRGKGSRSNRDSANATGSASSSI
jgi:hypothetical protein